MGRQINTIFKHVCCAVALPVLYAGVAFVALPVQAQDPPASDAERIEAMRDLASDTQNEPVRAEASGEPAASAGGNERASDAPLPANESLPLGAGEGNLFDGQADRPEPGSLGDGWLLSTLAALGVVLAIVFAIRWLLKRGGVVGASVSSGSVVEVLNRTTVAPRSHVVLLRVGARILVVSDSPAGMRTLASVHEAEEVAELLGAIDSAKPTSMSQSFGSVMKKLSGQWSGEEHDFEDPAGPGANEPSASVDQTRGALSRVRGRLAALSDAGGRA